MDLQLLIEDFPSEGAEEVEKPLPRRQDEMIERHLIPARRSVDDRVAHIAMAKLRDVRDLARAVGTNQAKINGRCGLKLDFEKLVRDVWKLSRIVKSRMAQTIA